MRRAWFEAGETPTLYDVGIQLLSALKTAEYDEYGVYAAPGGFAIVTRIEGIDEVGRRLQGAKSYPVPNQDRAFSFARYVKSLFFAPVGRYRFVVFIVTDVPFVPSATKLGKETAAARIARGAVALPRNPYDQIRFSEDHEVHAFIYEFLRKGRSLKTLRPGYISPRRHIKNSGILAPLANVPLP